MSNIPNAAVPVLVTTVETSRPRATPEPAGRAFRNALEGAAGRLLQGVEAAAGLSPAGAVVGAGVRATAGATAEAPGASVMPSGGLAGAGLGGALGGVGAASGTDQSLALLQLQQQMSLEQRQYMAVSNAMKARHDTAKSVLGNVR